MGVAGVVGLCDVLAFSRSISILRSVRALRFLDERVPGVEVPESVLARVENASDPEEECFELACELASHALSVSGVAGLHLISFRQGDAGGRVCGRAGVAAVGGRGDSRPPRGVAT